ncbi:MULTISPECIES: DNA adenine methylase [Paenibacillus]|uniref:DNA adenine methylase n=1 Tax=Paenibacillus TaxID=44249 RepID=UPI0011AAA4FC|nr:DNA adenine methylase [Paenibacillus sp. IHBB 10380]
MATRPDPFPTLGGKSQIIDRMVEIFHYCIEEYGLTGAADYFMGGNRLFLHLDCDQIKFKLANEIDRGVVAFFKCLQDPYKTDQLIDSIWKLADHVDTEERFTTACEIRLDEQTDEIISGALTYIVTMHSRATNRQDFCKANVGTKLILSGLDKLVGFDEIIGDVQIYCGDYKEQFHKYKHREDLLVWLDPPYLTTEAVEGKRGNRKKTKATNGYVHPFTKEDHELMIDNITSPECKNKIIVSGYKNDAYRRLEQNGFYRYFVGTVHVPSSGIGKMIAEYIWSNVKIPDWVLDWTHNAE